MDFPFSADTAPEEVIEMSATAWAFYGVWAPLFYVLSLFGVPVN
ncbi:hypothetical protein DEU38_12392 [Rhodococcus sp. AG1013]|nr:hypothetical protein DEU38_12392 [Rhodococcus sp. AG1013]